MVVAVDPYLLPEEAEDPEPRVDKALDAVLCDPYGGGAASSGGTLSTDGGACANVTLTAKGRGRRRRGRGAIAGGRGGRSSGPSGDGLASLSLASTAHSGRGLDLQTKPMAAILSGPCQASMEFTLDQEVITDVSADPYLAVLADPYESSMGAEPDYAEGVDAPGACKEQDPVGDSAVLRARLGQQAAALGPGRHGRGRRGGRGRGRANQGRCGLLPSGAIDILASDEEEEDPKAGSPSQRPVPSAHMSAPQSSLTAPPPALESMGNATVDEIRPGVSHAAPDAATRGILASSSPPALASKLGAAARESALTVELRKHLVQSPQVDPGGVDPTPQSTESQQTPGDLDGGGLDEAGEESLAADEVAGLTKAPLPPGSPMSVSPQASVAAPSDDEVEIVAEDIVNPDPPHDNESSDGFSTDGSDEPRWLSMEPTDDPTIAADAEVCAAFLDGLAGEEQESDLAYPQYIPRLAQYLIGHPEALSSKRKRGKGGRYFGQAPSDDVMADKVVTGCWACGKLDHESQDCEFKRCFICSEQGHLVGDCDRKTKWCTRCGRRGHLQEQCPGIEYQEGIDEDVFFCRCARCGETTHIMCGVFPSAASRSEGRFRRQRASQAPDLTDWSGLGGKSSWSREAVQSRSGGRPPAWGPRPPSHPPAWWPPLASKGSGKAPLRGSPPLRDQLPLTISDEEDVQAPMLGCGKGGGPQPLWGSGSGPGRGGAVRIVQIATSSGDEAGFGAQRGPGGWGDRGGVAHGKGNWPPIIAARSPGPYGFLGRPAWGSWGPRLGDTCIEEEFQRKQRGGRKRKR